MSLITYNPEEIIEILKKKNIPQYPHFDAPVGIKKFSSKLKNPNYIISHPFWPLIYFIKKSTKFHPIKGKKSKSRKLCYASYHDRLIYQYYAEITNQYYNSYIKENKFEESPIAYRTNLKQSNIDFAKKAFDCIREANETFIIVGDFKAFFDSLDHDYLKKMLCQLFKLEKLPLDWYKVFKSITQYSECDKKELFNYLKRKYPSITYKQFNKKHRVFTIQEFKEFKKSTILIDDKKVSPIRTNKEPVGIPQGTSISAVWANVYMLNFDKKIRNLVDSYNGYYMRYSDDFILILPNSTKEICKQIYNLLLSYIESTPGLKLEPTKTGLYLYTANTIKKLLYTNGQIIISPDLDSIDYLGFTFDGTYINIRPKTISKYYYRSRRKAKTVALQQKRTGRQIKAALTKLYSLYAISTGTLNPKTQNFYSYYHRAQKKFENDTFATKLKNPYARIRRLLNTDWEQEKINRINKLRLKKQSDL